MYLKPVPESCTWWNKKLPKYIGGEFHPLLGKQLSSAFLSFLVVVVVVVVRRRRRRHNRVLDLGETRQTNSTVKLEQ
jgi:hypothetical protein